MPTEMLIIKVVGEKTEDFRSTNVNITILQKTYTGLGQCFQGVGKMLQYVFIDE